jgi:hypothetical protein
MSLLQPDPPPQVLAAEQGTAAVVPVVEPPAVPARSAAAASHRPAELRRAPPHVHRIRQGRHVHRISAPLRLPAPKTPIRLVVVALPAPAPAPSGAGGGRHASNDDHHGSTHEQAPPSGDPQWPLPPQGPGHAPDRGIQSDGAAPAGGGGAHTAVAIGAACLVWVGPCGASRVLATARSRPIEHASLLRTERPG